MRVFLNLYMCALVRDVCVCVFVRGGWYDVYTYSMLVCLNVSMNVYTCVVCAILCLQSYIQYMYAIPNACARDTSCICTSYLICVYVILDVYVCQT